MHRILIVEDDAHEALLYRKEFEEEGYRVDVVHSGDEAIAYVRAQTPAVVVLDINMPVRDGIDTLTRLMEINNRLPVVLNTAYSAYKDNFMTWAAVAYVVKSSDLAELKQAVREAVKSAAGEGS
jgi:DNA-binding response OmpR family regulator